MATARSRADREHRFAPAAALIALCALGAGAWWVVHREDAAPLAQAREAYAGKDWKRAWSAAREHLKREPGDLEALKIVARAGGRLGRTESSRNIYKDRVGTDRMEAEDFFVLSEGMIAENRIDRAITVMQTGLLVDPKHPELLQGLARLYAQQDNLVKATRLAERLAAVPGNEARGRLLVGVLKAEQSDPAGTAEALDNALALDPTLAGTPTTPAKARKLLARARLQLHQPDVAAAALAPVLAAGADAEASWLMSRVNLQKGDVAAATTALGASRGFGGETLFDREPSPYTGSERCKGCHAAIHQSQQTSLHALTFYRTADLHRITLPGSPVVDPDDPSVVHRLTKEGGVVKVATTVKDETFEAILDFALGSGDRGLTFIGHDGNNVSREIRLSRYKGGALWDRTVGQNPHPTDPKMFLGLPISTDEAHACVDCHTTDGRAAREGSSPVAADRGIGCEKCHGPGENHIKAVEVKFPDLAIVRPQDYTAPRVLRLCSQCHSPRGNVAIDSGSPGAVRFQVVSLAKSRCYAESNVGFSCLTCHNPHRNAEPGAAFYEAKCLTCHAPSSPAAASNVLRSRSPCPVDPVKDCLRCHMPTVTDAAPHSVFTDHHIRIPDRPRAAE